MLEASKSVNNSNLGAEEIFHYPDPGSAEDDFITFKWECTTDYLRNIATTRDIKFLT